MSNFAGISPPLLEIMILGNLYLLRNAFKNNYRIFWTDIDTLRDFSMVNIEIPTEKNSQNYNQISLIP